MSPATVHTPVADVAGLRAALLVVPLAAVLVVLLSPALAAPRR